MIVPVHRTTSPRRRPAEDALGFGVHFTDHVLRAEYAPEREWHDVRVEAYAPLMLDPAAAGIQYAQTIFEGIKAFRGTDGHLRTFRLLDHCRRFASSAVGLCMPPVDPERLAQGIATLIRTDADWVPRARGSALYVRPLIIATEPFLGVRPATRFSLVVVLSPVGPYFGGDGLEAIRLWVERRRVRAAPGGIGSVKAGANYVASLPAATEAKRQGYDQVLWLDAARHLYLEEAGTMNVFVQIGNEVATPPLSDTILPGVTRNSVCTLLRDWGIPATERVISLDELRQAHERGELREVFGVGTAAVIAPVGVLGMEGGEIQVGDGTPGPLALRLHRAITAIQYGESPDPHEWARPLA